MKITTFIFTVCMLTVPLLLSAQSEGGDFMRSTGKIYVVVAVIVAIFLALIFFLTYLERRLSKLENQIKEHD